MSKPTDVFHPIDAAVDLAIENLPYAATVRDAYNYYQTTRAHVFLSNLSSAEQKLDQQSSDKLRSFINSEQGHELLALFVDNAIRTSSKVAAATLAFLYARCASGMLSQEDARFCCSAIKDADDLLLENFLLLIDRPETNEQEPGYADAPYKITMLSQSVIESTPELTESLSAADAISTVNELIRRRLFLPDYTFDRATPGHWTCIYGVNERAKQLRPLIELAVGELQSDA